jgi:electron transfer flavoprotein alpha subunit
MDIADLSALLGEDVAAEAFSDIWVVLPAAGAEDPSAAAVLGEARRQADQLGCYVHAVVEREAEAQPAFALGADRTHVTADAAEYLAGQHPEFVLLPAALNRLAAQIAQRLDAGLITNATGEIAVDADTRALLASRPVYGGDYALDLAVTAPVKIATLHPAGRPAPFADPARSGEVIVSDVHPVEPPVHDLGPIDFAPPVWRPLSRARTIVSLGRGLGGDAAVQIARELAGRLGAEVGGDRSARDSGWVDEAHEVGVTGQEVAPDVYLALGIRGDTIHNAAITGARLVIAVHPAANAPIFQAADAGIVGEPAEFLQALLAVLP